MTRIRFPLLAAALTAGSALLTGCNAVGEVIAESETATGETDVVSEGIDISMFKQDAFLSEPEIVDCVTAAGTETTCYQLVTGGAPAGREPGHSAQETLQMVQKPVGAGLARMVRVI